MQSRRTLLCATVLAVGMALWAGSPARAAGELRVLNWKGYGTSEPWALKLFEERTGLKVAHDYFNSEQEMLTKLRTSPGAYDVVMVNSTRTAQAAKEGLIQPIDPKKIGNFGDLSPLMRDSARLNIDGKLYGVAWTWGLTSYAYSTEAFKTAPDSIEVLWDPANKGKVGWRDDALQSVYLAAIATGQDMNQPADMAKIKEKLRALKGQIKTFWSSESEWNTSMAAKDFTIAPYWSGSAQRAMRIHKLPIRFVIPKEGAIGFVDGLSIAAKAPNPEAAAKFIDFMVSPEFYVRWDTESGAPASANEKAVAALPADAMNRAVLGDPSVIGRVQWQEAKTDEQRKLFQEIWDETKTYLAR